MVKTERGRRTYRQIKKDESVAGKRSEKRTNETEKDKEVDRGRD